MRLSRLLWIISSLAPIGYFALVISTRADSQVQPKSIVYLQATTPGSAQTGNANITGTMKAGQFDGDGTGMSNVNAIAVGGFPANSFGRVSTTNIWTGGNTFSNAGNSFTGSGSGLTNVNADLLDGLNSTAFLQAVPVPLSLSGSSALNAIVQTSNSSSSANSSAVRGTSLASTGVTYGGYFDNTSVSGVGAVGTAPSLGMLGMNSAAFGVGVRGSAILATGTGVVGNTSFSTGFGVVGENTNTTGGIGIFGLAGPRLSGTITNLVGIFGEANGNGSVGVQGFNSNDGSGVLGRASGSNGAGVVGQGFGGAKAGVFVGAVEVNGEINKDYGASTHQAVPIAYGTVGSAGNVVNGSGNWSVIWNAATTSYEITLTGMTYTSNMTAIVTPIANSVPRIGGVAAAGSNLGVTFFTTANAKVQVSFHFAVFDPQ